MGTAMGTEKARRSVWRLGYVIPRLLAVVCLVDIGLRFMSIDPFTFRAWEALLRDRPPGAAFEPNRRYYNARSYGDLAALGNFPELRQYRPEQFTTDALGFRNAPEILDEEVGAILAGDSFAVGSGVSDDETLSSRLGALMGCPVYNAGSDAGRVVPDEILALARRLHLRRRLVIRLYTEGASVPALPTRREMLTSRLVDRTPAEVRALAGRLRGLITVSPLRSLSGRAWKAVDDGRILPNRYAANVVRATLYNGDTMLFQAAQVTSFYRRPDLSLDYWKWLRDDLEQAGVDLVVVLVPGKYAVYRPFLVRQPPAGRGAGDYLDRLERALQVMGVPVLNLAPFLKAEVARHLERGEYLYWLDDIHWNARGIALAAAAIREQWPLAASSCAPGRVESAGDGRSIGK